MHSPRLVTRVPYHISSSLLITSLILVCCPLSCPLTSATTDIPKHSTLFTSLRKHSFPHRPPFPSVQLRSSTHPSPIPLQEERTTFPPIPPSAYCDLPPAAPVATTPVSHSRSYAWVTKAIVSCIHPAAEAPMVRLVHDPNRAHLLTARHLHRPQGAQSHIPRRTRIAVTRGPEIVRCRLRPRNRPSNTTIFYLLPRQQIGRPRQFLFKPRHHPWIFQGLKITALRGFQMAWWTSAFLLQEPTASV